MNFKSRLIFIVLSVLTAFTFRQYRNISKPLQAPVVDIKQYWGPGDVKLYKEDASIKPFQVSYGAEVNHQ
jgi:juvenile hormone epoxide hydrolase